MVEAEAEEASSMGEGEESSVQDECDVYVNADANV